MTWVSSTLFLSPQTSMARKDRRARNTHTYNVVLRPELDVDENLGKLCLGLLGLEKRAHGKLLVGLHLTVQAWYVEGPQLDF